MPRRWIGTAGMAGVLAIFVTAGCFAQVRSTSAGSAATLKERLSDKASDSQRVDNCKVPLDRRGSRPRPEGCSREVRPRPGR